MNWVGAFSSGERRLKIKVLLVNDDVEHAFHMRSTLARAGYEVAVAISGPEALVCVERNRPGILIVDHDLATMSGIDVCRRIKSDKEAPFIYTIILTNSEDSGLVVKALDAGADDYLNKSCTSAEFLARMRAGERIIRLEENLAERYRLESERNALAESVGAMEKVLGIVAHELRTPLAGLRTMSEFLLMPEAKQLAE